MTDFFATLPDRLRAAFSFSDADEKSNQLDMAAAVTVEAAQGKLPSFSGMAYDGQVMDVPGFGPVVVDLSAIKMAASINLVADHSSATGNFIGNITATVNNHQLYISGTVTGASEKVREVVMAARNGHRWQLSIGVNRVKGRQIRGGRSVTVNGREQTGPFYLITSGELREVTVCGLGCDGDTYLDIAAMSRHSTFSVNSDKEKEMDFIAWLKAKLGLDAEKLSPEQKAILKASYEADKNGDGQGDGNGTGTATGDQPAPATTLSASPAPANDSNIAATLQAMLDERDRQVRERETARKESIKAACEPVLKDADETTKTKVEALQARAYSMGLEASDIQADLLDIVRASRPNPADLGSGIVVGESGLSERSLSAALCLQGGMARDKVKGEFGDKPLSAAADLEGIGLREFITLTARMSGMQVPAVVGDGEKFLRAAVSVTGITNILEDAAQKMLIDHYGMVETFWADLAEATNVNNFQTHNRYHLTGTGDFEKVRASGELSQGDLADQKYTVQADTYGSVLGISRQDVVNDDLSAFLSLPRKMAEEGAYLIDDLLATLILANTGSFFGTGNGNYNSGATTALDFDALSTEVANYRLHKRPKTDKNSKAKTIGLTPNVLVVPPQLETTALNLVNSTEIMAKGDTDKIQPTTNRFKGMFKVISPSQLGDSAYTGYSEVAWYLMNSRVKPFVVSFLKGKRTPTIKTGTDPRPNYLGIYVQGYHDVGVDQGDPRVARKVKGEA